MRILEAATDSSRSPSSSRRTLMRRMEVFGSPRRNLKVFRVMFWRDLRRVRVKMRANYGSLSSIRICSLR